MKLGKNKSESAIEIKSIEKTAAGDFRENHYADIRISMRSMRRRVGVSGGHGR